MYLIGLVSQLEIVLMMTSCTRFVQCTGWYGIVLLIAMSLDKIKQLMKVWLPSKADLVMYNIYLPNKLRGIKVWVHCDMDTAYLHQFKVYFSQQQNSEFGLGWNVVMKLCKDISGKIYHVSCDNLFTYVQLLKDLLACKPYCNKTIEVNTKYLPDGIHKPGRMIWSAYKSYQDGNSNLVTTIWQDNRIVRLVSTNSNLRNVVHTGRSNGHSVIQVNQPQNIHL